MMDEGTVARVIRKSILNKKPKHMNCSDFTSPVCLAILKIDISINMIIQIGKISIVPANSMKPADFILFDWNGNDLPNYVGICFRFEGMSPEHRTNSNSDALQSDQNIVLQESLRTVRRII